MASSNIHDEVIGHIKGLNETLSKGIKDLDGANKGDIAASLDMLRKGVGGMPNMSKESIDKAVEMLRKRGANI